jgi:hypothetical protein
VLPFLPADPELLPDQSCSFTGIFEHMQPKYASGRSFAGICSGSLDLFGSSVFQTVERTDPSAAAGDQASADLRILKGQHSRMDPRAAMEGAWLEAVEGYTASLVLMLLFGGSARI